MRNSLFSHYLLKGLGGYARSNGDGMVRVFDLFDYIAEGVAAYWPALSQHPFFKSSDLGNNFPIALKLEAANSQRHLKPINTNPALQAKKNTILFDVFLCYNSADRSAVKKIGEQLKQQGILPWLDEWELQPGLPWQRALEQQIGQIKSAAVLVGKGGVGPWQRLEQEAFLREFVTRAAPSSLCYSPMRLSSPICRCSCVV